MRVDRNALELLMPQGRHIVWLGPLLMGFLAMARGQDANWDLQNYHWHNAWAWLEGRIGKDLAPAGFQSYFNPILDVFYYKLMGLLSPQLTGFVFGLLQGLNVIAVAKIGLAILDTKKSPYLPYLLAFAGCLGATFLSELGNTMGDNLTAVFVLSGLAVAMSSFEKITSETRADTLPTLLAGLLIGAGAGFKLTNAVYAVGFFAALCTVRILPARRLRLLFLFCAGAGSSLLLLNSHWFYKMWTQFGNPLFPQFNHFFKSPMASLISIGDTRFMPKDIWEAISFPFIMTFNPKRISEVPVLEILWPIIYLASLALLARKLWPSRFFHHDLRQATVAQLDKRRFLTYFFFASFVAWMLLFGIGRYLVPLTLLLPVVTWSLLTELSSGRAMRNFLVASICASVMISIVRSEDWGYVPWSSMPFKSDAPSIARPDESILVLAQQPFAWLLPGYPSSLRFASVGAFPESEGYRQRLSTLLSERTSGRFVILRASTDSLRNTVESGNAKLRSLSIVKQSSICKLATRLLAKWPKFKDIRPAPDSGDGLEQPCQFELLASARRNLLAENLALVGEANILMKTYDLRIDPTTCSTRSASIGSKKAEYQFCEFLRN